jgi:hypothetical protein
MPRLGSAATTQLLRSRIGDGTAIERPRCDAAHSLCSRCGCWDDNEA